MTRETPLALAGAVSPERGPQAAGKTTMNLIISGDTYPVRQQLKSLGCRWNGSVWDAATDEMAVEARKIVGPEAVLRGEIERELDRILGRPIDSIPEWTGGWVYLAGDPEITPAAIQWRYNPRICMGKGSTLVTWDIPMMPPEDVLAALRAMPVDDSDDNLCERLRAFQADPR